MARDTGTGGVLERMVLPALVAGRYHYRSQVDIGTRLGSSRRHKVDVVAWQDCGVARLVSVKWQQTSGTAEQKVPFEVMCLAHAVRSAPPPLAGLACQAAGCFARFPATAEPQLRAFLVLGGPKWTLREFYTSGALAQHMHGAELVSILTLEAFVAKANRGEL